MPAEQPAGSWRYDQKPSKILLDKHYSDDYSVYGDKKRMINDIDIQILKIIQQDARVANAEIARQVNLAPSAVLERIRKLEDKGIVRGYSADITPIEVGFGLTVFVNVRTSECGSDAGK